MSKTVDWGLIHGEGEVVCTCDAPVCASEERVEFTGGSPSMRDAQNHIQSLGWFSKKIDTAWYDFCSTQCYNSFLRKHEL